MNRKKTTSQTLWPSVALRQLTLFAWALAIMGSVPAAAIELEATVSALSAGKARLTGTPDADQAAQFIQGQWEALGFENVGRLRFSLPVRRHHQTILRLSDGTASSDLLPFVANSISTGTIAAPGITAPLVYAGDGSLAQLEGKPIAGAIVMMDLDSGKNWQLSADLGALACIYVDRQQGQRHLFEDKLELTPVDFPRFWMDRSKALSLFGQFEQQAAGRVAESITIHSHVQWQNSEAENLYLLVEGQDPALRSELLMVEAFYDNPTLVLDRSPGADAALGIATLMQLAARLKAHPPARSVLLVATAGQAQSLAGMREMIWPLATKGKQRKAIGNQLKKDIEKTQAIIDSLTNWAQKGHSADLADDRVKAAVEERIKTEVDRISRELMRLRMAAPTDSSRPKVAALAKERFRLRKIGWLSDYHKMQPTDWQRIVGLAPTILADQKKILKDVKRQHKRLKTAFAFRALVQKHDLKAVISLHLSSHGNGFGAFNRGALYMLKPTVNRIAGYSQFDQVLKKSADMALASEPALAGLFQDTLRPNRLRPWQSYFADVPQLGAEVSSMAGFLGISLATVNDARGRWGTPQDLPEFMDWDFANRQSKAVCAMIGTLADLPKLPKTRSIRKGFATIVGRTNFIRHGELFADQPAPHTVVMAFHGNSTYHVMTDSRGQFLLKGMADKKHMYGKVILEGYRFDPTTGAVIWAIDKKQTGKTAYRIKVQRRSMRTDLVMFGCRQTNIFGLLEPRGLRHMTHIELIDARREAPPLRYWYSRIDTLQSTLAALFLEPDTRYKLTLSDTVRQRRLILLHANADRPQGTGYRVEEWPRIENTQLHIAQDMLHLVAPRVANLEKHGIYDEKIRTLLDQGQKALNNAQQALHAYRYRQYTRDAGRAWALAARVYNHVDEVQKDVLFGVLFYIALFVPFAYCMERLLFSFSNIHKRIAAFLGILLILIAAIYRAHPAFELAYSPMVVILAFFIMGLSLVVAGIIFLRFENEMVLLQRRAGQLRAEEANRWKTFAASFFLGVNNLRRRPLRTALTCLTLIILTFTILSFTAVKSIRQHARLVLLQTAPYQGLMLKKAGWKELPPDAWPHLAQAFGDDALVAPRVWRESSNRIDKATVLIQHQKEQLQASALVGLSALEAEVTGLQRVLTAGRWLNEKDRHAILLPERMARRLGITAKDVPGIHVQLWGDDFEVIGLFSAPAYEQWQDLDGEPLTPVTYPSETTIEMTDVEMEAVESGEDVLAFQSRYKHSKAELTCIVPYQTLLSMGGKLKSIAARPSPKKDIRVLAQQMVDRFQLSLFSGEPEGVFLYHASDGISYKGVPNILVPMILSILIVLNTMIGSVYERKKEIGIYTSVGLAPSHVSFLFIAEAMAFAVISVILGYLLAQISAAVFAGSQLWEGITVNYSSLSAVGAMLLVMAVVLVSAIYPSRIAARIAIPDVNRLWKMPAADSNKMSIPLPFLLSYQELRSAAGFLIEYFQAHKNASHGLFSTDGADYAFSQMLADQHELSAPLPAGLKGACLILQTRTWLAPFDFGIMQRVEVHFCPSKEEPRSLEIRLLLIREAGEAAVWGRINKVFVHQLRKQMLIWRSLETDLRDQYRHHLTRPADPANLQTGA